MVVTPARTKRIGAMTAHLAFGQGNRSLLLKEWGGLKDSGPLASAIVVADRCSSI